MSMPCPIPNLTDSQILYVLKMAKNKIISGSDFCMCYAIKHAIHECYGFCILIGNVPEIIPEFNREFCGADPDMMYSAYWWDGNNKRARLAAFDKLIAHYQHKIQEENQ